MRVNSKYWWCLILTTTPHLVHLPPNMTLHAKTLYLERRRFEKTNQQIIQQNVQLNGQLRSVQKVYQEVLLEKMNLERKVKVLEGEKQNLWNELYSVKVRRTCHHQWGSYSTDKKEISERAPAVGMIASHLNDLAQLLTGIANGDQHDLLGSPMKISPKKEENTSKSSMTEKSGRKAFGSPNLDSIQEVDGISNWPIFSIDMFRVHVRTHRSSSRCRNSITLQN